MLLYNAKMSLDPNDIIVNHHIYIVMKLVFKHVYLYANL